MYLLNLLMLIGNATYAGRKIDLTYATLAWMTDVILIQMYLHLDIIS